MNKDPRENTIDLDKHAIWESDNRVEGRYVWNAAVLDLCDLPVDEYMKNPIVDAIEKSSQESDKAIEKLNDNVMSAFTELTEDVNENKDEIVSAITETAEIIGGIISGAIHTQIVFYYASVNQNVPVENLTLEDFVMDSTVINSDAFFRYTLGDPTEEDWEKFINGEITEDQLRERSFNNYYLMLPNAYGTTRKFIIEEDGTSDVTNDFVNIEGSLLEGFTLLRSNDPDHFNIDFPSEQNVQIIHKLKIVN